MAEANKSGILAKAQKRISRTKTKVLQTLGKAEKYTDETFDDLVLKTEKQHEVAHHLQKELKSYLHCMRALSNSSKSLAAALSHTYEEDWTDEIGFKKQLEVQDLLWTDYMETMQSAVMEPMNTYMASFPPLKVRTAKRGRKMMDFDNARHNLEVLQAAKKKDEAKITKAQEDLNESKQIFDELHSELCTELPNFYNSRVTFYADLFQKMFKCENRLHAELARISEDLTDTSEKLSKDHVQFVYTPKRPLSKSLSDNEEQPLNGDSSPRPGTDSPASSASPAATPTTPTARPRSSAPPPLAAAAAASGGAGAGAIAEEDGEDKDEDDAEHLYGNQEAVRAATKVNGDVESEPKSESLPPEDTTTTTSTPETAAAEEGCPASNPPAPACDDSNTTVRGATTLPHPPALPTPRVDVWDDREMPLYLAPLPLTRVAPPESSSLSLPVASVHAEEKVPLPREEKKVLQISKTVYEGTLPMSAPVAEQEKSPDLSLGEKEEEKRERGACIGQRTEAERVPSGECHSFIDTSFQQEMDTALKEELEARSQPESSSAISTSKVRGQHQNAPTKPPDSVSVTEAEREASSELSSAPASVSDFESLADVLEKKQVMRDSDKRGVVTGAGSQRCYGSTSGQKEDPGLPQNQGEVAPSCVATACAAISLASSEFLITSSFSDVSSCQNVQSPLGEVYEHITFSSQEDLGGDGNTQNVEDGDRQPETAATEGRAADVISAEAKKVISALELAIRSASSPGLLLSEGGEGLRGGPAAPLLCSTAQSPLASGQQLMAGQQNVEQDDEGLYENVQLNWKGPPPQETQTVKESPAQQMVTAQSRGHGGEDSRPLHDQDTEDHRGTTTGKGLATFAEYEGSVVKDLAPGLQTPDPSVLPTDPVTGVMLKPPVFLIAPYTQRGQEKDRLKSPKKEGGRTGEEGKKSLSHKGFDMVRSMLHLPGSKSRNSGPKSKAAKSVDLGSPGHSSSSSQPEDDATSSRPKRLPTAKWPPPESKSPGREEVLASSAYEGSTDLSEKPEEDPHQKEHDEDRKGCRPEKSENCSQQGTPPGPEGLASAQEAPTYTCTKISEGSSAGSPPSGHGDSGGKGTAPLTGEGQHRTEAPPYSSAPGSSVTFGSPSGGPSTRSKSSGQSLNPLAPPFKMPTSTTGPKPGLQSATNPTYSSPSPVLRPSASDDPAHQCSSVTQAAAAPSPVTGQGQGQTPSLCADVQPQSVLSRAPLPLQHTPKPAAEGRKEDSFPLPHPHMPRNSCFVSAVQDAFCARPRSQSGPNRRLPRASFVQQSWHPSEGSFSPLHGQLEVSPEGWGGHGGDVVTGAPPSLPLTLQKSLWKGEVARSGGAPQHKAGGLNLSHPHLGNISKLGEGDVAQQLAVSPLVKEAMVTIAKSREAHKPPVVPSKAAQKISIRTPSPQTTASSKASDASFDLDTAREVWRNAWRASSIPDTTEDKAASESKEGKTSDPHLYENVSMSDVTTASRNNGLGISAARTKGVYENVPHPLPRTVFSTSLKEGCKSRSEKEGYVSMQAGRKKSGGDSAEAAVRKTPSYENMQQLHKTGLVTESAPSPTKADVETEAETGEVSSLDEPPLGNTGRVGESLPQICERGVEHSWPEDESCLVSIEEKGEQGDEEGSCQAVLEGTVEPAQVDHTILTDSSAHTDTHKTHRGEQKTCAVETFGKSSEPWSDAQIQVALERDDASGNGGGFGDVAVSSEKQLVKSDSARVPEETYDQNPNSETGRPAGFAVSAREEENETTAMEESVEKALSPTQGSVGSQDEPEVSVECDDNKTEVRIESDSKTDIKMESDDKPDIKMESDDKPDVKVESDDKADVKVESDDRCDVCTPLVSAGTPHTCGDYKETSAGIVTEESPEDRVVISSQENEDMSCSEVEQRGVDSPAPSLNTAENVSLQADQACAPPGDAEAARHQCGDPDSTPPQQESSSGCSTSFLETSPQAAHSALQNLSPAPLQKGSPAVSVHQDSSTAARVEKTLQASEGLETLGAEGEGNEQGGVEERKAAGVDTDITEHGSPQSWEQGCGQDTRERNSATRRTQSMASLVDSSRAAGLDSGSESCLDTLGLLPRQRGLALTPSYQREDGQEAAASGDQVAFPHGPSGQASSATEWTSVDVTSCDSAISAMWESGEGGRNGALEADPSTDLVVACDSGISTSEVTHSSSELRNDEQEPTEEREEAQGQAPVLLYPSPALTGTQDLVPPHPELTESSVPSADALAHQPEPVNCSSENGVDVDMVDHSLHAPSQLQPDCSVECREVKPGAVMEVGAEEEREESRKREEVQGGVGDTLGQIPSEADTNTSLKPEKRNIGADPENQDSRFCEANDSRCARGDEPESAGTKGHVETENCAEKTTSLLSQDSLATAAGEESVTQVCQESSAATSGEETVPGLNLALSVTTPHQNPVLSAAEQTTQTGASHSVDLNCDSTPPTCGVYPTLDQVTGDKMACVSTQKSDPETEASTACPQENHNVATWCAHDLKIDTADAVSQRDAFYKRGSSCDTTAEDSVDPHVLIEDGRKAYQTEGKEESLFQDCVDETTRDIDKNTISLETKEKVHTENMSQPLVDSLGNSDDSTALSKQEQDKAQDVSPTEREVKHTQLKVGECNSNLILHAAEENAQDDGLHQKNTVENSAHKEDSTHSSFPTKDDTVNTDRPVDKGDFTQDWTHKNDSLSREDPTPEEGTVCKGGEDSPCKESSVEGEGSEGFEVTGFVEEDSMDIADQLWETRLAVLHYQTKAQSGSSTLNGPESPEVAEGGNVYEVPPKGDDNEDENSNDDDDEGDVYHSPPSNKPVCEPPPSTLYQVEATHAYNGEDIDELSFDPGDIIYVVPFDNEEEQDDGWQMGIKQRDGLKGVFPENFTRRL